MAVLSLCTVPSHSLCLFSCVLTLFAVLRPTCLFALHFFGFACFADLFYFYQVTSNATLICELCEEQKEKKTVRNSNRNEMSS